LAGQVRERRVGSRDTEIAEEIEMDEIKASAIFGVVLLVAAVVLFAIWAWLDYQNFLTTHLHPLYHLCVN